MRCAMCPASRPRRSRPPAHPRKTAARVGAPHSGKRNGNSWHAPYRRRWFPNRPRSMIEPKLGRRQQRPRQLACGGRAVGLAGFEIRCNLGLFLGARPSRQNTQVKLLGKCGRLFDLAETFRQIISARIQPTGQQASIGGKQRLLSRGLKRRRCPGCCPNNETNGGTLPRSFSSTNFSSAQTLGH